ncbi:FK506-binding protein 2B [Coemansia sp. Benny D115]|nr:FK506-binding protein 2B [Coemansia sp. Benny D115]
MSGVEPKWTIDELNGETVSKKELVKFLQETGNSDFLLAHKLNGQLVNVTKTAKRPALLAAYKALFETKQFRTADDVSAADLKAVKVQDPAKTEKQAEPEDTTPKYTKKVTKKGTGERTPSKGDRVSVFYTGSLEDGTVFDSNMEGKGRKPPSPLKFKVGTGMVIRGWDEALMTMVQGEEATLTIQPEWAYGQKGVESRIPPNATLIFNVKLVEIN